jgi:hypothetical protein
MPRTGAMSSKLFSHPSFDNYDFEYVPLDRDVYLMDEKWMEPYARAMVAGFEGGKFENIGYIGCAAARLITSGAIEISWYPNVFDRFHEMRVFLPREKFVACVGSWQVDEKPHIFVRSEWLTNLYLRSHSTFVLIDAIGIKRAIQDDRLSRENLIKLRDGIDAIAAKYPHVSFISFADSLLLKSNWQVGTFDSDVQYTYEPEQFIRLVVDINALYKAVLDLGVYAIFAQGSNAYYDDPLLHVAASGNHVSLNSLGVPFAQLLSIDKAVRGAIRTRQHPPAELYMDEMFFRSLNLRYEFRHDSCASSSYREPMLGSQSMYYFSDAATIVDNIKPAESTDR